MKNKKKFNWNANDIPPFVWFVMGILLGCLSTYMWSMLGYIKY